MFSAKKWDRVFYSVRDSAAVSEVTTHDFSFELKRLAFAEGALFNAVYVPAQQSIPEAGAASMKAWQAMDAIRSVDEERRKAVMLAAKEAGQEPSVADLQVSPELLGAMAAFAVANTEADRRFVEALPEGWLARVFAEYVRGVRDLEIDGQPVTDGTGLLEIADDHLVMCVLTRLHSRSALNAAEGKALPSRSTSQPVDVTADGASAAQSAAPEDGTRPETAPETPSAGT